MWGSGLRATGLLLLAWALTVPSSAPVPTAAATDAAGGDGLPVDGQPAADVIGSHDATGNPTFVGGLTNSGPTIGSVW